MMLTDKLQESGSGLDSDGDMVGCAGKARLKVISEWDSAHYDARQFCRQTLSWHARTLPTRCISTIPSLILVASPHGAAPPPRSLGELGGAESGPGGQSDAKGEGGGWSHDRLRRPAPPR